jgi:hypothetical protein
MKTAAAFAKGLLELEGDLPPILVSLVHKEKGSMHMLDTSGNKEVKMELEECKKKISANLQRDIDWATASEEIREQIAGPLEITSLRHALSRVGNPRKTLFKIHEAMGELIKMLDEMLDEQGSGDEKRIEGGEGLAGRVDDDDALSGVKLYKGETLLELTERWRFIYDRMYDSETDRFDLSRIPDLHDNARFDVLHNPHLGLSNILHQIYDLGKLMADCVVPQEYGTTIAEKRSVGVKICHGLLEKIKFDLNVARTDNDVDMRYMINMAYGADMNINTMGRRIRTRLYFTSESHLHTVLSVLRFANAEGCKSILSERGIRIINSTPELCYLTQIILRVFEDSSKDIADPRRFRVEIQFSPGATATPFHLHELDRDTELTRLGAAPLKEIGRPGLTCEELEAFFVEVIKAGKSDEDEELDALSISDTRKAEPTQGDSKKGEGPVLSNGASKGTTEVPGVTVTNKTVCQGSIIQDFQLRKRATTDDTVSGTPELELVPGGLESNTDEDEKAKAELIIGRKYFWGGVAVGSLMLGFSCLVLAFHLSEGTRQRRRWSRRY